MIYAFHAICGVYGFWLPNDPRGSWSEFVRSWELFRYGKATKVHTRESRANVRHDERKRLVAKGALKFPPVRLTGDQARAVGEGFHRACLESGYAIHALAIMPEHTHVIVGRTKRKIGRVVGHLKGRATQELKAQGLWPYDDDRDVWADQCWKVYIDSLDHVANAIPYVDRNPEKEGLPRQKWNCITPFPFHKYY
jgi:REP element-mobilizing transposase RayT